jgi:transcriptional regulator of acetoin/glycerol metabolism
VPGAPSPLDGPADGLAAASALRAIADEMEDAEVERAMRAGWTWSQVAEALGVTRQAVHKKHLRRLLLAQIELRRRTGE